MTKRPAQPLIVPKNGGSAVSVGSTTTVAAAANLDRESVVFTNDSDEVIYLSFTDDAAMNSGIRLNAAGGSYEINTFNYFNGAVNAICASGSKVLGVVEV